MTESTNNSSQRRRPGQARGLRARNRSRNGESQNNQQRQNNQQSRPPQPNRHRKNDNTKNGAKPGQRRKPTRQRAPHSKLDSELDFRLSRPSSLQQQSHNGHDDGLLFSQTQVNGHRKGKPMRNGQQWNPSDGGIYLHEMRGSDWYREDQARYAAKQIALENAEKRHSEGEARRNGESQQARRQTTKPRNPRNPRAKPNTTSHQTTEAECAAAATPTEPPAPPPPPSDNEVATATQTPAPAPAPDVAETPKAAAAAEPAKPKPARKSASASGAKATAKKKVSRARKPATPKKDTDSDTE